MPTDQSSSVFKRLPRWLRWSGYGFGILIITFFVFHSIFPFEVDVRYSTVVTANDGTVLHAFLSPDDKWRMQLEPHELTPELRNAMVDGCIEMTEGEDFATLSRKMNDGLVEIARLKRRRQNEEESNR